MSRSEIGSSAPAGMTDISVAAIEAIASRDMASPPNCECQFLAFFAASRPAMRPNTLPMVMPMPAA